jgi:glutamate-5-semialdehyde dehydrogenase
MLNQQESSALDIEGYMRVLGQQARQASYHIARATTAQKNAALLAIARAIDSRRNELMAANGLDLQAGRGKNLEAPLLDRLELTPARIDAMISWKTTENGAASKASQ